MLWAILFSFMCLNHVFIEFRFLAFDKSYLSSSSLKKIPKTKYSTYVHVPKFATVYDDFFYNQKILSHKLQVPYSSPLLGIMYLILCLHEILLVLIVVSSLLLHLYLLFFS